MELEPLELIIVIPAYNEQACIASCLQGWTNILVEMGLAGQSKVLAVNDGSRDSTGAILDAIAKANSHVEVLHKENGGHGSAVMAGYRWAIAQNSKWVFQVDSDEQFVPSDLGVIWAQREQSPFLLGFRKERHDPAIRLRVSRILKLALASLFGRNIPDPNIPFRLMQTSYLESILNQVPEGVFAPNVFLSILAARDGINLGSLPVTHHERSTGTVSIAKIKLLRVCLRSLAELLVFRFRLSVMKAPSSYLATQMRHETPA